MQQEPDQRRRDNNHIHLIKDRIYQSVFSVIVCTRDRLPLLRETVAIVRRELASFPNGTLIVVDNGSSDGTGEYLQTIAAERAIALSEPTPGLYNARVRALQSCRGEYVIFIDDDVLPVQGWIAGMLHELIVDPRVGVVGTAIDPVWEGGRPEWMTQRIERYIPVYSIAGGRQSFKFPRYPTGTCLAMRVCPFLSLYAAPERRYIQLGWGAAVLGDGPVGGEDSDLCELFIRNGLDVIAVDHVRVRHRVIAEKLSPLWLMTKFESDGRALIRYSRLAGYPAVGPHTFKVLLAYPVLWVFNIMRKNVESRRSALLMDAYYRKSRAAWRELLWGIRNVRFPYTLNE